MVNYAGVLIHIYMLSKLRHCRKSFLKHPDQAFLDVSLPGGITAGGKATEEARLEDMEAARPCRGSEL